MSADSTQPGRGRNADPEAVVLADEEQRQRQALVRDLRRRVQRGLRGRVVQRGVAERAQDDRVLAPRALHAEPRRTVDRERHPDRARQVRRDRRGHREHRELLAAEHLVPSARDRLDRRRHDAEQDVTEAVDLGLRRAGEVERARAVVQERRVVGPQRERDRGVRLVPGRADRVEAPAVLLEPARRVVGLAAVDLRAPDLLDLGRSRAQRGARLERAQSLEEMLLERIELVRRRPAAPARRSTHLRPRARSCGRGGRRRPVLPRCSTCRRPTPAAPTAGARGRRRTRAATARRSG